MEMPYRAERRRESGLSAVEMICGGLILLTIVLALIDLGMIVIANTISDSAVKNAARAAAGQQTESAARTAANQAIAAVPSSPLISSLALLSLDFNQDNNGLVKAKIRMGVRLPVPVPGYETINFDNQAVEPLVAVR